MYVLKYCIYCVAVMLLTKCACKQSPSNSNAMAGVANAIQLLLFGVKKDAVNREYIKNYFEVC